MTARSWLAALVLCAAGCGPPTYALVPVGDPPSTAFSIDGVALVVGQVVEGRLEEDGEAVAGDIDMRVDVPAVARVDATTEPGTFLFLGVAEGNATARVSVDDDIVATVPITVAP